MSDCKRLLVYLAGHIHGDWRDRVRQACEGRGLPIDFAGPCTDHGLSDSIGTEILGVTEGDVGDAQFFKQFQDLAGGSINDLRTRVWIARCDLVVAFFDAEHDGLRQWNTPSDIAEAARNGKPVLVVGGPKLRHSLKEVVGRADAAVQTLEQAVDVLAYICGDS